jgi:hypothetical protein
MSKPPVFTAEQVALLQAALEHIWSRMARLQGDLNDNAGNVATLLSLLVERGILTPEQFESAVEELTATAGLESGMRNLNKPRITDASISADILNGDVDAFRRRALAEEDDE